MNIRRYSFHFFPFVLLLQFRKVFFCVVAFPFVSLTNVFNKEKNYFGFFSSSLFLGQVLLPLPSDKTDSHVNPCWKHFIYTCTFTNKPIYLLEIQLGKLMCVMVIYYSATILLVYACGSILCSWISWKQIFKWTILLQYFFVVNLSKV